MATARHNFDDTAPLADAALLAGRVLLSLIFLMSGWSKLLDYGGTVESVTGMGAPIPPLAAVIAIVLEFGCAALVIIGLFTRLAALGLFVFVLAATWLAHLYWAYPAEQQMIQYIMFWKNIGMAGGFLLLAGAGGGAWSVDGMLGRRSA